MDKYRESNDAIAKSWKEANQALQAIGAAKHGGRASAMADFEALTFHPEVNQLLARLAASRRAGEAA